MKTIRMLPLGAWLGPLLLLIGIGSCFAAPVWSWTNLAGQPGGSGTVDGTGGAARFSDPFGVAVDGSGNLYVADNDTIRKVTPAGVVSTLAGSAGQPGSADGTGSGARFNGPEGVAVDGSGNVYVADTFNSTLRKITPAGVVTTLAGSVGQTGSADGTGSAALFNQPNGVAVDAGGNVYAADSWNHTIRKITPAGLVTTLAGSAGQTGSTDGTGSAARFYLPYSVVVDGSGNLFVADTNNKTIRKITPAGVVSTVAGAAGQAGNADGTGSAARFSLPTGVTVDGSGNVYVADNFNNTIRKITPGGLVSTLAGSSLGFYGSSDGTGSAALFYYPQDVAVDGNGNVYVADTSNSTIRKITPAAVVSTLAGSVGQPGSADGTGSAARFNDPEGVAVDGSGNIYVADTFNSTVRKITPAGVVTTLAGSANQYGSTDGTGSAARFVQPFGVAADGSGNVYVADTGNSTIRKITPAGVVSTLAGSAGLSGSADGTGSAARFNRPEGVAVDGSGNVYVCDTSNVTIRKVTPAGVVSTLAGSAGQNGSADGTGSAARFNRPEGVAVDASGNIYVADAGNNTIRKITPARVVSTVAGSAAQAGSADGTGSAARFHDPTGVAVDGSSNLYVADSGNSTIRKITTGGVVSTIGGLFGVIGGADGVGSAAAFEYPSGITVSVSGTLWVADTGNNRISKGTAVFPPVVSLAAAGSLAATGATLNGTVNPNGFATTAYFEYGLDATYGGTASVTLSPNNDTTAHNVSAALTGLTPGTIYHYRLTASNVNGMVQTSDGTFTTAYTPPAWRQKWYGTTNNSGNAADTADPYYTGVQNLAVYAMFGPNQNPAQVSRSSLPPLQKSGGKLFYSFSEPAGVSGVVYGAEWINDLSSGIWTPVTDTGSGTTHTFSVPMGENQQLFIRLKWSAP